MFNINQSVKIIGNPEKPALPATVRGSGMTVDDSGSMIPCVIVELTSGYYDPMGGYVRLMVVHPDNVVSEHRVCDSAYLDD